jgi:DNA-binding CsgD family transcriptional regulator
MPTPAATRSARQRPPAGGLAAAASTAPSERRVAVLAGALDTPAPLAAPMLLAALDRLSCPLLLVRLDATWLWANHAARGASELGCIDGQAQGRGARDGATHPARHPARHPALHAELNAALVALRHRAASPDSPGSTAAARIGAPIWILLDAPRGERAGPGREQPIERRGVTSNGSVGAEASPEPPSPDAASSPAGARGWALLPLHAADGRAAVLLVGPAAIGGGEGERARFAARIGLTPAETRVLGALSQGADPDEIALRLGVGLATVRSHLAALRTKSGHHRLTALLQEVAALPPVASEPLPGPAPEALLRTRPMTRAAGAPALRLPRSAGRASRHPARGAAAVLPWLPTMLDALGIGLLVFDGGSRLTFANAAARRRWRRVQPAASPTRTDGTGDRDVNGATPGVDDPEVEPDGFDPSLSDDEPRSEHPSLHRREHPGDHLDEPPAAGMPSIPNPHSPLCLYQGALHTQRIEDAAPFREALAAASEGQARLLRWGSGERASCLSLLPLPGRAVLGVLGLERGQDWPVLAAYARQWRLTGAEARVLMALAAGEKPSTIARQLGVAMSTLRTQIGSLRAKSGAASIRDLVCQLAALPPVAIVAARSKAERQGVVRRPAPGTA